MFTFALCLVLKSDTITVSTDGPVKSLNRAVELHRSTGTSRILLKPGIYFIDQTVVLDGRDAGLTIEGTSREKTILCGGSKLSGWRKVGADKWVCKVPEGSDFRMLVVNGEPRPRSRYPETGRLKHRSIFDVPWMSSTGGGWKRKPTDEELTTMKCDPKDLGAWFHSKSAEVTVYHMWDESCVGVKSYDPQTGEMTFATPLGHPAGAFGVQDYVVWNTDKGLTKPGTWYLDKEALQLVYRPMPREDPANSTIIAPKVDAIIRFRPGADRITLRNLGFTVANTPLRAAGFGAGEAESAIRLEKAKACTLESLSIFATSGAGIRAWDCPNLKVERCRIRYTGGCGIRSDAERAEIADNEVSNVGYLYPSAAGIWVSGASAVVSHNRIADTPYSAIIGGGNGQLFEKNLITRCMLELHDGAAIYAGFASGMVLRGNVVRDVVDTGGYGASAYYLDEQATDCIVEENLSVNVVTPCHNHMAKNNTIRNNVFVSDREMRLTFARCAAYRFERNVLFAKGAITFFHPENAMAAMKDNVVYSLEGKYGLELYDDMYSVKEKLPLSRGGVFANPRFRNLQAGDYGFQPDSIALEKGIKSLRWDDAGPRKPSAAGT